MGVRPQGRLVGSTSPPWRLHGLGRGPRKQCGNRSPDKSAKMRFCDPLESKNEFLGGHFDVFFESSAKVRTELSPARELRLASLERSRARPFSCSCSREVKCWIPVWLFRIFIDFGVPWGSQNEAKILSHPSPTPAILGLGGSEWPRWSPGSVLWSLCAGFGVYFGVVCLRFQWSQL